ncbi:phosphatidic acid phosphatase type 2/haloperoxidase [Leucosporidium creatinivorum]|uniref:Phosphatidic acid phosphatase type 2/haloperoxidase n=1 Tax=Leucosporidium creatinivorum TaxID=106004 RepID=A0A1Y2DML8_9BASI|nr:phosphatidic acid phosphatase type 2/haloperoxidase [Leucosporidium creatinivorum]
MDTWNRLIHGPDDRRKRPPVDNKRRLKLLISYAPDWAFTLILLGVIGFLTEKAGFKREFSLTDTSIQHTFATKERISFGLDIGLSAGVPAAIILIVGLLWRRSFWDVHNGWLGLFLSCSVTTVITQVIKCTVGRPRPDMIDRCQPIEGAANRAVYGLATIAVCQNQTGHTIDDGFKSFPSGHSSLAFAGLGFLSLYLAGKLHLFDRRGVALKAWIFIAPYTGAALIAISRTMDYRHHATDVLIGSLIGFFISILVYHLYYPSLTSHNCHLPFSPRIPRATDDDTTPHAGGRISDDSNSSGGVPPYRTPAVPLRPQEEEYLEEEGTAPRPAGGARALAGGASAYGRIGSRDSQEAGRKGANMV